MSQRPISAVTPQWFGALGEMYGGDDVFRNVAVGGGEVPAVLGDDALEGARLPQLLELGAAQARAPHPARLVPERELHHPLGVDVGEWIEQDAVDDAEHRARGPDAQARARARP